MSGLYLFFSLFIVMAIAVGLYEYLAEREHRRKSGKDGHRAA